jgi:predicted RND superfamily exporter protein
VGVLAAAVLCFRSFVAGAVAFLPVAAALLLQFALMGLGGVWLSLITSMGSALAIGLSIDFGIHAVDRLLASTRSGRLTLDEALRGFYARTGRALLLNFVALFVGFGVLTTSLLPAMREFGLVLVTCIATGFVASMVFLPALVAWLRPGFLTAPHFSRDDRAALDRAA